MSKKIPPATITDHDMEQLQQLAAINKVKLTELLRRIIAAYLDGRRLP
jgi:hypothetical protein